MPRQPVIVAQSTSLFIAFLQNIVVTASNSQGHIPDLLKAASAVLYYKWAGGRNYSDTGATNEVGTSGQGRRIFIWNEPLAIDANGISAEVSWDDSNANSSLAI